MLIQFESLNNHKQKYQDVVFLTYLLITQKYIRYITDSVFLPIPRGLCNFPGSGISKGNAETKDFYGKTKSTRFRNIFRSGHQTHVGN